MNNSKIFNEIYSNSRWTDDVTNKFSSGAGSTLPMFVDPYIEAIEKFTRTLDYKPNVFDLGCGNFNVGSKIRHLFNEYHAGDVVEYLVERNKQVFKNLDVNFFVFDAEHDDLPLADIVFVRQVFQHLSNGTIQSILNKLKKYKYIILTEHYSHSEVEFNLDKITGPDTRYPNSAVDITNPPFNYTAKSQAELCMIDCKQFGGLLRTIVYEN